MADEASVFGTFSASADTVPSISCSNHVTEEKWDYEYDDDDEDGDERYRGWNATRAWGAMDASVAPSLNVPIPQNFRHSTGRVNLQCTLRLDCLGLDGLNVSCTLDNTTENDWMVNVSLQEFFIPNEVAESHAKGATASLVISNRGCKMLCKGASLTKLFQCLSKVLTAETMTSVNSMLQKIVPQIQVSLEVDVTFGSEWNVVVKQLEIECAAVGLKLAMTHQKVVAETDRVQSSNPTAKIPGSSLETLEGDRAAVSLMQPQTSKAIGSLKGAGGVDDSKLVQPSVFCFQANIEASKSGIIAMVKDTLGMKKVAKVLQKITDNAILKMGESTTFRLEVDLEVGNGVRLKSCTVETNEVILFGLPLCISSSFSLGDQKQGTQFFLALQRPVQPVSGDPKRLHLLQILRGIGFEEQGDSGGSLRQKVQRALKKITVNNYSLLLQLADSHSRQADANPHGPSCFVGFFMDVSIEAALEPLGLKACLLHCDGHTCISVEFSRFALSSILKALFDYDVSLPVDVELHQFEFTYKSSRHPDDVEPRIAESIMEHVENKSFLGACTSAQRLLRRKESLYLCISLCCILTDSFFDILNLKGHRFEACLIFSDSGFHVDIDLGNFSLPAAGLESGGCRLKLMAYPKPKVEIQTNLKFSNGLQMTAVLKGTVVPPSLVASLSLESEIPLSTFHHSLSHLAIYGLRGELTLAPSCVSIFFSGGVRTTWTDGPAPAFAAAFRVTFSAGLVSPTTVYLFCDNLTIGAVIRIFRRCSYADVEALDRALPNIKELGLLLKLDNEELTSLPQPKDRADNSLLRLIQNKTQRTTPLLEATENFIGFTAHLSWLGLEAKVLLGLLTNINVSGGPPSAALELSIAIRNWTCTVRSTILFILGQCEVTLSVDTARRTAGFSFTTQITILPSILDLSLSSEIRFSCAPSSLFLSVEIRISLLRTPNCEENTVVLANSEAQPNCGVEMGGVLQVTWTKGLPSIQARLNCRNIECSSVVSAILDGLHDCIRGITQLCLRGLRRAQRIVSRFLPEFVQGLLVDMVQMAADVAEAVESGHINTLKETLMNMCEGKLLVKNLSIGGPVSSEKSSAKVIVTYDIIMSGQAIKGTMGVNLKTLLSDIAKKLLQFLLKWKSNKSKTPEEHKPPSLDPDSSYKTERASSIPLEHYAEMKVSGKKLHSLIADVCAKYDRDGTVSPEDPLALQLTTRDLNDPLLCDVPVIKQQVFECQLCKKRVSEASLNRHVDICAANVKSKCPLCGVEVMAVDQERHMAVECSKRQESRSEICEYCTMEVEPGRKREHHNNLCQGQWECPKCNSKMVRKEQYHHLTGSCPNRAPGDVCGRCKCFRDSTHVMFCMNCRKEFKVCKVHSCQKTVECQHCKICVPRGSEEMHWRDECTAAPIACAVCGCPLAPGKPAWERKKEHSTSCPGRHVICRYCMELFPLNQIAEHKFSCQRRLRLCRVKNCGYKVSNEDYNSVYKYTSCPFCYTPSNSYLELRRHLREDACPKYRMLELRCSFCGDPFIMRSLAAHLKGCKRFQVPCPTCPGKFTLKKLRKHILRRALRLDKTCSMPLPCPYCMQPSFFFDSPANGSAPSIREHLLWCTKAPRFCGFCQSPLLGCNQVHHLQFECEEFKVPCFFCSSKVAMHCLPSHLRCCKCIKLACIFPDCHAEPMTFDELEEHLKLECDYFFVSCLVCHCPVLKKEEKVHWQLHKSAQCIQNLPPDCFLASTTYGNNLHHLIPLEKKHLVGRDRTSLHRLAKVRFLSEDAIQQEEGANLLPCPRCHETIAHYDLIEHLNFFCPSNLQTCPLDCGWDGPVCHMFKHLTEQCYLAEGGCIYDPGCCELPAWQFRFQQELALVLYPAEKLDIEMQEVGVYHLVKNHFTQVQENSGCSDMEAEEALYTSLCTTLHRQKKHIGLRKRDETRHAIFCEKRGELCFFCCHYVTDLPHHIQSCPASIQKTLCNYCGEKVACFQIIYHWLYLCTSSQFSVNCPNCKKYIPYRDLDLHLARDCAASSVSCPCCASHIEVKDYPAHILQSCKRSGVNTRCGFCRQQCPSTEILEGLHQTNCKRCNLRRCPFGATEEHARTGSPLFFVEPFSGGPKSEMRNVLDVCPGLHAGQPPGEHLPKANCFDTSPPLYSIPAPTPPPPSHCGSQLSRRFQHTLWVTSAS